MSTSPTLSSSKPLSITPVNQTELLIKPNRKINKEEQVIVDEKKQEEIRLQYAKRAENRKKIVYNLAKIRLKANGNRNKAS
jgi:hypothetical protein